MRNSGQKLSGSKFGDVLTGSDAGDTISGHAGADTLVGGQGDVLLTGGAGQDAFSLSAWDGQDTVTDYQAGEALVFHSGGYAGPQHFLSDGETFTTTTGHTFLAYNDANGDARLVMMENNYHGDSFTLVGVSVTQINTGWLQFL
jgi:Ca2+-binding RTX toxin-like protein